MVTGPSVPTQRDANPAHTDGDAALQAIREHHAALDRELAARVAEVLAAARQGGTDEAPAGRALVTFLVDELLPHAAAEEERLYPAAAADPRTAVLVRSMLDEHRELTDLVRRLRAAADPIELATTAAALRMLFTVHVHKENEYLLPELLRSGTDLNALLSGTPSPARRPADPDAELTLVVDLLIRGLRGLGGAGQVDLASRLAGRAWSVLRVAHPRPAEHVNGLLHYLARLPAGEVPSVPNPSTEENTMTAAGPELDVRQEIPARRHELIFATYGALAAGGDFVLVNDHDPKPLYYQFAAEHAGQFTWDYLEEGPEVWKVRIGRVAN